MAGVRTKHSREAFCLTFVEPFIGNKMSLFWRIEISGRIVEHNSVTMTAKSWSIWSSWSSYVRNFFCQKGHFEENYSFCDMPNGAQKTRKPGSPSCFCSNGRFGPKGQGTSLPPPMHHLYIGGGISEGGCTSVGGGMLVGVMCLWGVASQGGSLFLREAGWHPWGEPKVSWNHWSSNTIYILRPCLQGSEVTNISEHQGWKYSFSLTRNPAWFPLSTCCCSAVFGRKGANS